MTSAMHARLYMKRDLVSAISNTVKKIFRECGERNANEN